MFRTKIRTKIRLINGLIYCVFVSTVMWGTTAMAQDDSQPAQYISQNEMQHDPAERVSMRLASRVSLAGSDIDVAAREGVVTLAGTVPNESARERAVQIARRTRGVSSVRDELTVVYKGALKEVADEELAGNVARTLTEQVFTGAEADEDWLFGWEVDGYNYDFDVEADEGTIRLEGDVNQTSDIIRAVAVARAVPGVHAVEVDLDVNSDMDLAPAY